MTTRRAPGPPVTPRIGSLFSGAGGLDVAVAAVTGGTMAWHSEVDAAASTLLKHRFPTVPNHRDITGIDWAGVEPVDILCGGFPCQDVSSAGRRAGITHTSRSGLWSYYADAIAALQPRLVIIENVRGLLSARAHRNMEPDNAAMGNGGSQPVLRAMGAVLGDLADLGFDARWCTVSASSVGAPHRRERVFILAHPAGHRWDEGRAESARLLGRPHVAVGGGSDRERRVGLLPTPSVADASGGHANRSGDRSHELLLPGVLRAYGNGELLPTPRSRDHKGQRRLRGTTNGQDLPSALLAPARRWGQYADAIDAWSAIVGPPPSPTEPNAAGNPRLNAAFPEWMMGWPRGWVTDLALARNAQLRIIGNGVVPQQAAHAIRSMLAWDLA